MTSLMYENEVADTGNFGYDSGYSHAKDFCEQAQIISEYLKFDVIGQADQQGGFLKSEGFFTIPPWQYFGESYIAATCKVLEALKHQRKFENFRQYKMSTAHLRLRQGIGIALGKNLLPAQFGLVYRGRSVRSAREMMLVNEIELGPFEAGIMLLTHPKRLEKPSDLWVVCSGAGFSEEPNGKFDKVLYYCVRNGWLELHSSKGGIDEPNPQYGIPTAFVG